MPIISRPITALFRPLALAAAIGTVPLSAPFAQNNPGYFIPPSPQNARPSAPSRPQPVRRPQPTQQPMMQPNAPQGQVMGQPSGPIGGQGPDEQAPAVQMQLPPMPTLPAVARGAAPPTAVIGVLGIPEIMRASSAAIQIEKTINERRERLNQDAQKEQLVWREMQQSLANDRAKLSADQIRAREKELQDRITGAQKTFRDRNRIIQEAGQYGLAQIERILVSVIRAVAESRGMNLVLHRAQVALNVNEFDITEQVVEQLNKVLPTVNLPADGVEPPVIAASAAQQPGGVTPASAPPSTPPPEAPTPPAK